MGSDPVRVGGHIRFGADFELDLRSYELRRSGRLLKLERIPTEVLLLLIEARGQLVSREEIIARIWGKDVFLDTDNSINAAIRKIRLVLKDDPEQPRFVQTIVGRGYRFIAPVAETRPSPADVPPPPQPVSAGDFVGKEVSHYRILAKLGSGGMGVVYEAEDIRLGRRVALKFLPENLAGDPQFVRRFEREARAASSLNHPNICTVYEVEEHAGQPVIVMELLEGESLTQRIREGTISTVDVLDFGIQACDALEAAHAKGIIHRDIKPGNLFLVGRGRVKILDFGLAKVLPEQDAIDDAKEPLTQDGIIPGTTCYMSPEQVRGEKVDARSDLFSLGVVLFEMATGERPFVGRNRILLMNSILNTPAASVSKLNPSLPVALDAVIARALEKKREKRFQHAVDLCAELKRLRREVSHEPAVPVPPPAEPHHRLERYGSIVASIRDRLLEKPAKAVEIRATNLPVQRTGFVGREKEVSAARDLVLRPEVRLVTVTGPGGIGKTRLAVQVANRLVENFPAGTYFVPLASLTDPGLIASVIASMIVQALAIRDVGTQAPMVILKDALRDRLRGPMLLVLDNFEHLIAAAPTVAELLAMAPQLKIMVTSRAVLHVYGEHEFPVPPLALPDPRVLPPVDSLSRYSAVRLFLERAVAAKPDFELNQENASAVAEICVRLDGLPLAIELAAARVKVLSPASMRTRLAGQLQLLTGGARDLPLRQQTLRAAIDWSYDLLNVAEQRLFRRLSVFVGGCTLEGVEAVCDTKGDLDLELLDGMASMVDKSLLQQVEPVQGESRFAMLHTIREYALEKLKSSGELAATRRAHAAYCLVLAEEEATEQNIAEGTAWLERCTVEHDNFRAALEWLTESGETDWGLRLGAALFRFWEAGEYLSEGRDRLGKLLKLAEGARPTKAAARALFAAGVFASAQRDYASADALTRKSLEVARQLGDSQAVAVSLNALAVSARDQGEVETARSLFEESLSVWRELGDRQAEARALSNLANAVKLQGDYEYARSLYAECMSIFQELNDSTGVAWSLNYQGDVERERGDSGAALALYEEALTNFRQLEDRWGIAGTLADLGSLAREQGNCSAARALYRESIKLFQELGHKRGIARLLECFACAAASQHEPERSLRLAGAAAALRQTIGAPLTVAEQVKLEAILHPARSALAPADGAEAWSEGKALPMERAVEEALLPETSSPLR
ncbi:MAG TPA: protein kinase [Terriglobales bacterium]|nr:protein kinase [Terriglobales bacterium]